MREVGSPGDWLSFGSYGLNKEEGLAHTDSWKAQPMKTMAIS